MGKLIRDNIPAIVHAAGGAITTRTLDGAEFLDALKDKLVEEAGEVRDATTRAELLAELADVAEVFAALAEAAGVTAEEVETARAAKNQKAGAFTQRLQSTSYTSAP